MILGKTGSCQSWWISCAISVEDEAFSGTAAVADTADIDLVDDCG
jgi:hypothetical protein